MIIMFFDQNKTDSLQKENLNLNIYTKNKNVLLGELLQKAGLITSGEIEVALEDQKYHNDLKLGEILATRGWVKQQTADFFASQWQSMITEVKRGEAKYRLGECLNKAGLITRAQVQEILELQKITNKCFGEIAVEKGYIKQITLDLFIENLCAYDHHLNQTVEVFLNSAKKLVKINQYSPAILELRKALKYNPHHSAIHGLLSIIYIKQKQLTMASIHIKKAQRSNPDEPLLREAKSLLGIHHNFSLNNQTTINIQSTSNSQEKKDSLFSLFSKKLALA